VFRIHFHWALPRHELSNFSDQRHWHGIVGYLIDHNLPAYTYQLAMDLARKTTGHDGPDL
jgi:hypothetical protein